MIRESGAGERSRARAIESEKMRSDHSESAIGHRFAAVYCFGPFAGAAVVCFLPLSCSIRSFQSCSALTISGVCT